LTDQRLKLALSDMQGKLFELSGRQGYDSELFMKAFMNSKIAEGLDSDFDYMQWAGKEYILERMMDEYPDEIVQGGTVYEGETLYWTGYLYRYWHFYTGESSKFIYKTANAKTMNSSYYGFHTLDIESAIDRLKSM